MTAELTIVTDGRAPAECARFFHSDDAIPLDLSQEEWTAWVSYAAREHRSLAWRVAELIEFGMDRWSETYYTLIEMTGYANGYVKNIEWWVNSGLIATRKHVLSSNPECESVPNCRWEDVAPIRDAHGRAWSDMACDRRDVLDTRKKLILTGWGADGALMENDAFRALCVAFREERGIPGEVPTKTRKRSVKTDTVDAEFTPSDEDYKAVSDAEWRSRLSNKCNRQIDTLGRYFKMEGAFTEQIVETAIDQLYTIKKARLSKYEEAGNDD